MTRIAEEARLAYSQGVATAEVSLSRRRGVDLGDRARTLEAVQGVQEPGMGRRA